MSESKLKKAQRLSERPEFTRLFESPELFLGAGFTVFWKTSDRKTARMGITLKGKVRGIFRTQIKRIFREWFRLNRVALEAKHGKADFNFVFKLPDGAGLDRARQKNLKTRIKLGLESWASRGYPSSKGKKEET